MSNEVPVWGIEAGDGLIRAVRAVRNLDGTFLMLAYEEQESDLPGPEGLVRFIKQKGLKLHPLVVAIRSPDAQIATVKLSPEDSRHGGEDLRDTLLEFVHPEPEEIDLRFHRETSVGWRLVIDARPSVEKYLVALETLGVRSYALISSLEAIHQATRSTGLFEGDGILVGVQPTWTDVFFFEGETLRRQGLPIGTRELAEAGDGAVLAGDLVKLVEYERTRVEADGPERMVILGIEGELAESVAGHLPTRPLPFPGDAGPVRGKGRLSGTRGPALLRLAPAAVGAAIAGAAKPYRLDLAFRTLPDEIRAPKANHGIWAAASVLLLLAFGIAFAGLTMEVTELEKALAASAPAPRTDSLSPETAKGLSELSARARRALALREAVETLYAVLPGEPSAPYRTDALTLAADGESYRVRAQVSFPGLEEGEESARMKDVRMRLEASGKPVQAALREGEPILDLEFAVEAEK